MKNLLLRIIKAFFGKEEVVSTPNKPVRPSNVDGINFTRADLFLRKSILDKGAWQSHYDRHSYSLGSYQIVYDLVICAGEDAYAFEIGRGGHQFNEEYGSDGERRIVFEKNINNYPDVDFSKKLPLQSVGSFIDDLLCGMFHISGLIDISDEEVKGLCVEIVKGAYKWDANRTYHPESSDVLKKLASGTVLHQAKEELYQIAKAYYAAEYDRRMEAEEKKREPAIDLVKRQELKALARKNLVAKGLIPG